MRFDELSTGVAFSLGFATALLYTHVVQRSQRGRDRDQHLDIITNLSHAVSALACTHSASEESQAAAKTDSIEAAPKDPNMQWSRVRESVTTEDVPPQVIFSYQSQNVAFLTKLREWLNSKGIDTVDGTQTPPGGDWRHFYFGALRKGSILLPILSKSFVYSRACESELTFAADKGKTIIPILLDPEYSRVLDAPEDYTCECEDIELRAPKLEAILACANRIPASLHSPFDQAFEANGEALLTQIQRALALRTKSSGVPPR